MQPFKPALVAVQKRYGARMDCSLAAPTAASTSGAESWALAPQASLLKAQAEDERDEVWVTAPRVRRRAGRGALGLCRLRT